MATNESRAWAKIQVEVEVPAPGAYGKTWTLDAVYDQAGREAMRELGLALEKIGGRIIGNAVVLVTVKSETRS